MALLQVHQAKALRDLHEGGHDLAVLHELRAETDLALRATKVTAQSLGRAMSTLVVQERHLWLCLADMKEQEKVQFLNAPVSQTGLFGDAVESFAQQFSAAQKQTEAFKHIMRRRKPAASTPAAALSLLVAVGAPCGRLRSHAAAAAFHQAALWSRSQAGCPARPGPRQTWRQAQVQEALRRATQRGRRLLTGRWSLHLSLPRRRAGWSILFLFRRWPDSQQYPKLHLREDSSFSGSQEGESCELCITGFTDASATGWGATYNGHAVSGVWTGPQLRWHINCLELLAVRLALSRLRGRLRGKDVLVRTDNTATVAYINRQGGLRSRRMSQLARHLLLWSQKHLRSLRAIHIPGVFNQVADELSRAALPGEWRLHPQAVQLIGVGSELLR